MQTPFSLSSFKLLRHKIWSRGRRLFSGDNEIDDRNKHRRRRREREKKSGPLKVSLKQSFGWKKCPAEKRCILLVRKEKEANIEISMFGSTQQHLWIACEKKNLQGIFFLLPVWFRTLVHSYCSHFGHTFTFFEGFSPGNEKDGPTIRTSHAGSARIGWYHKNFST